MSVLVNNERLTPSTLDPNAVFAPSSYPDHKSSVTDYKKAIQMVLEDPADREALTKALQDFQKTMVVEELIDNLKEILDAPNKRRLYKYISPLIPSRLRAEYKSLVPHIPGFEKKMVRLKQQGNQPFGFTARGGKEFDCGIYVVKVLPSSKAAQNGLKPGDQIIRVNGLILSDCTHEEFVNLIKLRKSLALAIRAEGLVPELKAGSNKIKWKTVGEQKSWKSSTRIGIHGPIRSTKRIQVTLQKGESLGANVKISSAIDAGVLIVDVTQNSPAYVAGLKPGDEIVEVNSQSLIGKSHDQAIAVLKSGNSLMMTIRVDAVKSRASRESTALSDFEFTTHDHDTDAQMLSNTQFLNNETFVLKQRTDEGPKRNKRIRKTESGARISVLDTEVQQSRTAPVIASPAAFGHGPTLAMPTLLGMGQQLQMEEIDHSGFEFTPLSLSGGLMGSSQENRHSSSSRPVSGPEPPGPPIPKIGLATVDGDQAHTRVSAEVPSGQQHLSSFQFPVDDDDDEERPQPVTRQQSAMKKAGCSSAIKGRRPTFSKDVEFIPERQNISSSISNSTNASSIHPSNYTFSEEVLKGRKATFHTIPKDGPLRLAIRGGRDTPLGAQIIISRIIEGGAAAHYGKINVGDQILVIDGISLLDVTHDEAGQAFKRAMEMDSPSINLIVAANPEAQT